eukprot:12527-Chlamydomonas_euryale.AAC.2
METRIEKNPWSHAEHFCSLHVTIDDSLLLELLEQQDLSFQRRDCVKLLSPAAPLRGHAVAIQLRGCGQSLVVCCEPRSAVARSGCESSGAAAARALRNRDQPPRAVPRHRQTVASCVCGAAHASSPPLAAAPLRPGRRTRVADEAK